MEPLAILVGRLRDMGRGAIAAFPQILISVVTLIATWLVAWLVGRMLGRMLRRTRMRSSLQEFFLKITAIAIWITGTLIAMTILFPSVTPAKMLTALGVGSIAVGLAFKDVFENFLAGILILLREPMRQGDHIECQGVEGAVETITIRDTYIRQTDGQLVLMPNATLFKNPVAIRTDLAIRRTTIICGIAYAEDIDRAREVMMEAVKSVESLVEGKPVQIFAQKFADSGVEFEITWWTGSKPVDIRRSRDQVVASVKRALDDAGIEIPFPYRTLVFKEPLDVRTSAAEAERQE